MKLNVNRLRIGGVLAAIVLPASMLFAATPASADHTMIRRCGVNYLHEYTSHIYNHDQDRIGRVVIAVNHRTGRYCAVLVRRYHKVRHMNVRVKYENQEHWFKQDPTVGRFQAGPVHVRGREDRGLWVRGNIGKCYVRIYWEHDGGGGVPAWPAECAPPI